jgi:hypothetical protein
LALVNVTSSQASARERGRLNRSAKAGSQTAALAQPYQGRRLRATHGQPVAAHLKGSRVDERDILEPARQSQGLERMEQIKYAVLERSGQISIIPW